MTNPKFVFPELPETNWVRKNFEHMCGCIKQSYPEYHFATTLGKLQMVTGRRAYIKITGRSHYSNLNHLLLGAPATSNKTDAIVPLKDSLSTMFPGKSLPGDFSGAGLLEALEENPSGFLIIDEAGTLLNRIANNKEAGIIRDTLCKVYDNDTEISKQLKSHGKDDGRIEIINAFPTILLGTTPDTFSKYSSGLDMTSGWFPRFLMYNPDYEKPFVPLDFDYDPATSEAHLLKELNKIGEIVKTKPGMKFTPDADAKEIINRWHKDGELEYEPTSIQATLFRRLMVMGFKLAINFMLGDIHNEGKLSCVGNTYAITPEYIKPAIKLIDDYFLPHSVSVLEMVERDASKNVQDKIITVLKAHGGKIERWRLSKNLHIPSKDRDMHLDALFDSKEVTQIADNGGTVWCRFYKQGDHERMQKLIDEFDEEFANADVSTRRVLTKSIRLLNS